MGDYEGIDIIVKIVYHYPYESSSLQETSMATKQFGILRQNGKIVAFTAEAVEELQKGSMAITKKDVGTKYDPSTTTGGTTASSCRRPSLRPGTRR
jgi:hypothetical protein